MAAPTPNPRYEPVSPGALLARQFVTLLLLMISLAISFTFLFVQQPPPPQSAHATIVLDWPGMRPDLVSPALTPHLAQMGNDGVIATDHHAQPPFFTALTAPKTSGQFSLTPSAKSPVAAPAPLVATPPASIDPFVTMAQVALNNGLSVAYEGVGGAALLQAHPTLTNAFVLDGATAYPTELPSQLRAAHLTPPGDVPALDAAHAPDTARTEALTQAFTEFLLPKLKVASFLAIIHYNDPAATGTLTGIGSPAMQAALREDDNALGEIFTALNAAGIQDSVNLIVTSDHGLVDVISPDAASAASQSSFAPTNALRTDLAALIAREALRGANGVLPDVGAQGVSTGAMTKHTTVVVTPYGGFDIITVPDTPAVAAAGQGSAQTGRVELAQEVATFLEDIPQVGAIFLNDSLGKVSGTLHLSAFGPLNADTPDILVSFASSPLDVRQRGTNINQFAGSMYADTASPGTWGGLSRHDLHTIFYAVGPGFKQGVSSYVPSGTEDLVPTVESLLNLTTPAHTPGRAMNELLNTNADNGSATPSTRVVVSDVPLVNGDSYMAVLVYEDYLGREYLHAGGIIRKPGATPLPDLQTQAVTLVEQE